MPNYLFYCCGCGEGPQSVALSPHCYNCDHAACDCCTVGKLLESNDTAPAPDVVNQTLQTEATCTVAPNGFAGTYEFVQRVNDTGSQASSGT